MKKILPIIALALAIAALIFSCFTFGQLNSRILELEKSNEILSAQVEAMSTRMDSFFVESQVTGTEEWTLVPTAWPDGNGADLVLTMSPAVYDEKVTVRFLVNMEHQPMADVVCRWNGTAYTATVGLPAMNGYSYFCVFESADGTDTRVLASPDIPTLWEAVYLEDALNSYCDLLIDGWNWENNILTVTGGFAQLQLAQLLETSGADPEAELTLVMGETLLHRQGLELIPGEGQGSYEAELKNLTFDSPQLSGLEEHTSLQLWLEIRIGSQILRICGAEWYPENGQLMLAAG